MTYIIPTWGFNIDRNLPRLQRVIIERTDHGAMKYSGYGHEITAPLESVARAVESAYVLVEKATLPKVTLSFKYPDKRTFSFAGDPFTPYTTDPNHTADRARKTAAKWLSIAAHLEAEEKTAAAEAKLRAEQVKAEAERVRHNRLNLIADRYFGKDFDELGDNKASAVKEIYRLEEQLKTDTEEEDAA